jgi:hypothetical protein
MIGQLHALAVLLLEYEGFDDARSGLDALT